MLPICWFCNAVSVRLDLTLTNNRSDFRVLGMLACLRGWGVCVLTYLRAWRARMFDVLVCSRACRVFVFACFAYVLAM